MIEDDVGKEGNPSYYIREGPVYLISDLSPD